MVAVVVFVVCFLMVPMAVFETYCLAAPALLSDSSAAVPPLSSADEKKQTNINRYSKKLPTL